MLSLGTNKKAIVAIAALVISLLLSE